MRKREYFRNILGLIASGSIAANQICLAENLSRESSLVTNPDYSIFSDSERHFLSSQTPQFKTVKVGADRSPLPQSEVEVTLREIELKKFGSESEDEFLERGSSLYAELLEHPEIFQEKARDISASRSRFRSGLLTPLTINQLDSELGKEVLQLEPSQLSKPIKVGDSIFLLRREPTKLITKPDQ